MGHLPPFKRISSLQNPRIKNLLQLQKSSVRTKHAKFGVEGAREISRALECSFSLHECYLCPSLLSNEAKAIIDKLLAQHSNSIFEIDEKCFAKISVRKQTDGIYALFHSKARELKDCIPKHKTPVLLVIEGIEKPGNLGALLRSADGAGASGVIMLNDCCDPFNPQVVRSSLGTVFSIPLVQTDLANLKTFISQYKIETFAALLSNDSRCYTEMSYTSPCAFFLGSEAHGLSDETISFCQKHVMIPMLGISDSLNVSVAGATLLYEALRQRSSLQDKA